MSRDEQIKKLAEDWNACINVAIDEAKSVSDSITIKALVPYATSLVEKDEEIARLKEKLGIAEGIIMRLARGGPHEDSPPEGCLCRWCIARRFVRLDTALAAIREKGKE